MLKKLAFIGVVTGVGQLFSVFVLKYLLSNNNHSQVALLGQADALSQFLINLLAFGLQAAAMRTIALQEEWRSEFLQTQKARLTISCLLLLFSAFAFYEPVFLVFILVPLFALNGDYALYATGHPLTGALVAFARIILPFGGVAAAAFFGKENLLTVFIIVTLLSYLLTNTFIAYYLNVPLVVKPVLQSLKLYYQNLQLGLVSIALYFLGYGLVLIAPYLFPVTEQVAVLVAALKFYILYKGVLRIIHQAYLRNMLDEEIQLVVDKTGLIAGTAFLAFFCVYPQTMISIFVGESYVAYTMLFIVIAVSAWVYTIFSSVTTIALLRKIDKSYAFISTAAALLTVLLFAVSAIVTKKPSFSILALLTGEVVFAVLMIRRLQLASKLRPRLFYAFQLLIYALLSCLVGFILGDTVTSLITSVVLYASIIFFSQQNLIKQMLKEPGS
jgi:hypothetical protein